jgi:inosine-uridine nucleoside N-ribohydrolase
MPIKVLLDTDIGSDIDDAVCLAYLLANPECELLGITTVTGEAEKRAQIASALCNVAGMQIPIYPGAELPLLVPQRQMIAHQAVKLDNWEHNMNFPKGKAIHFMQETIRAYPGEVTLLAIGPLTNLALLFRTDPEIAGLLKATVVMGGVFSPHVASLNPVEWNTGCDPHATAIVAGQPLRQLHWVGLDVTTQVRMPADDIRRSFQSNLLRAVLDFAEVWFQKSTSVTFHDPLAAATIFDSQVCGFETGLVEVDLSHEGRIGRTSWSASTDGPHQVAIGVDVERYFRNFFHLFESG